MNIVPVGGSLQHHKEGESRSVTVTKICYVHALAIVENVKTTFLK